MGVFTDTVETFKIGRLSASRLNRLANMGIALTTAWTPYSPTLSNLTLGSGAVTANYRLIGKTLDWRFKFLLGAGSAVGSDPAITIPSGLTLSSTYTAFQDELGTVMLRDSSAGNWHGPVLYGSSTSFSLFWWNTSAVLATINSTNPFTWTTTDALCASGSVQVN